MIPTSDLFKEASRYSTTMLSVVDIYQGTDLVQAAVPLVGGKVKCDRDAKIRWTADVSLAYADWQKLDIDPTRAQFKIYRGISSIGKTEMVQLGTYRLDDFSREQRGEISLSGSGFETFVSSAKFLQPRTPPYGSGTIATVGQLVNEAIPGGTLVRAQNTTDKRITATAPWARERLDAVKALADSINAELYADNTGQFTLRDKPSLTKQVPVAVFKSGPNGVLLSVKESTSSDNTYNAVSVSSTSSDASVAPFWAWAYDNNPTSPTYFYGPFGQRPRFYSSQFFTSNAQCLATAQQMLLEQLAPVTTMSFNSPVMCWLEAGDVVSVERQDGTMANYMLSSVSFGLNYSDTLSADTYTIPELASL